ncbi:hypothetical protein ACLOJK_035987 [Asimina triloba]
MVAWLAYVLFVCFFFLHLHLSELNSTWGDGKFHQKSSISGDAFDCLGSPHHFLSDFWVVAGCIGEPLSYDYSATAECLTEPPKPQYQGGILINPEFNHGLNGWSRFGLAHNIEERVSKGGNKFIVAHSRNQSFDSFSQKLYLQNDQLYTFSAWIQVSEGNTPVAAVFKTRGGFVHAGSVAPQSGCWSMLKGGLTVEISGLYQLYFESNDTAAEIWVDSVSLQPFTQEQWKSHQDESIEKVRKRKVRFQAVDADGNSLAGATLSIIQTRSSFPFGSAIASTILNNPAYQNWFTARFGWTVFENELKWYSTEKSRGQEDYSTADAMFAFARQHGIDVRGHNIFWDDPKYQPWWVPSLSPDQLRAAAEKRITSVVGRYAGQVIGWDVDNENLHTTFFESKLGADATSKFFQRAHQLDGRTAMFMNEYNTIEDSRDGVASPPKYLSKLKQIMGFPGNQGPTGIGLEGHFSTPNIPYMRSALDTLASGGVPIWLTEIDVAQGPNQAQFLEQILREGRSHPGVQGIMMWTAWHPQGCYRMCLTDNNFNNLPTGNVVDKLLGEWKAAEVVGTTDQDGFFEVLLFHGDYNVTIAHPSLTSSSMMQAVEVGEEDVHYVKVGV